MSAPRDASRALADLRDEGDYLDGVIVAGGADLALSTPAAGWTISHQLGHLLWTDRVSALACRDRAGFARHADTLGADPEATVNAGAAREADGPADELIASWRRGRTDLLAALGAVPAGTRIPWFGPSIDAPQLAASRLMETWAHGLDITDSLGLPPSATDRLRRVADLGVRTRDFAFSIHARRSPSVDFGVELKAPDGDLWTWGPAGASDRIIGSALDFCMLVTQRRHRDDLDLQPTPGMADHWMDIAQAFAGPAGKGRPPRMNA